MTGFLEFIKSKCGALAKTSALEIFVHESVLGSSIELGGFEGSASKGLKQEPLLLLRLAHLRKLKHGFNAVIHLLHHIPRRRGLTNLCVTNLS
jgi:hypothetical protein